MIVLLQRVSHADVVADGVPAGAIGRGLLVFVAAERGDTRRQGERLAQRLLGYRVFPDEQGRMSLGVADIGGGVLLVPQFTLAADTAKGMRPSFSPAAEPALARELFELVRREVGRGLPAGRVQSGVFGADMQVSLTNDGPVTFSLRAAPDPGSGR